MNDIKNDIKKIGILGGTFNPPHYGHIFMAEAVKKELKLEKVIFLPCFIPPHKIKDKDEIAAPEHRLEMVKLAIAGKKDLVVSDIEIKRKKISYTKDTLIELKQMYKDYQLYFIIGTDTLYELDTWHDIDYVLNACKFVAVKRPNIIPKPIPNLKFKNNIQILNIKGLAISSTRIRQRIKEKRTVNALISPRVLEYINKHNLYK